MKLGLIGLGRMGGNIARRLMRGGHSVVVFDQSNDAVSALAKDGAIAASSLADLYGKLDKPAIVWVMLPAGQPTEATIDAIAALAKPEDVIIDGGNTFYKDDIRRAAALEPRGVRYVDVGTSGGVWGLERGYCMMIGGFEAVVNRLDPIFNTLAPGYGTIPRTAGRTSTDDRAERGYIHAGPAGAGHFVKMIHNGIEYGLMQAYAEGFSILKAKKELDIDLEQCANIWQKGSVVRSWLLDLTAEALRKNPELEGMEAYVSDSGEGRWTVFEAIDLNVSAPVITESLIRRLRSREENNFTDRMLSVMRNEFGGHAIKKSE